MPEDHIPDRVEKGIRFGCGFLFGLAVGFGVMAIHFTDSIWIPILIMFILAFVFGLGASRHGDRFWTDILVRLRWLWWFFP
jgi:hypothetical protein